MTEIKLKREEKEMLQMSKKKKKRVHGKKHKNRRDSFWKESNVHLPGKEI